MWMVSEMIPYVEGIYPTLEIAKRHYSENFHYQEFEFGKVTFDIYDAKEAYPKKRKKKKDNKR